MINIKYAILGLSKKLSFTIITILQLTITFAFLYNIIYIKNEVHETTQKVISTFQKNNTYLMDSLYGVDSIMNKTNSNFIEFYDYLKNNKQFTHCTAYEDHLLIKPFNGYENFLLTNMYKPKKEGSTYYPIKVLKVDYNYIKEFQYKVILGSNLTENDFTGNDNIPILLGNNYKDIYKVNDKISYYDYKNGKQNLIVKGFIDSGYNFVDKIIEKENIKNLDNYIIYPLDKPKINDKNDIDAKYNTINSILESFVIINSNNNNINNIDIKNVIQSIRNKANKEFDDVKLVNIQDRLNGFINQYKLEEDILKAMFIIIFSMCFIGIIANIANSIRNSYKKFAIHLLNGATIKDMNMRIFYELFIIMITSFMLALSSIKIMKLFNLVSINLRCIIELGAIIGIIIFIIFVITSLQIRKISISQLLRRE